MFFYPTYLYLTISVIIPLATAELLPQRAVDSINIQKSIIQTFQIKLFVPIK